MKKTIVSALLLLTGLQTTPALAARGCREGGSEPGGASVLDEMIALVKYGATPKQALVAAAKNSAEAAGWDDMGTLAVGKQANFVVLDGDPNEDILAVKKIKSVVFHGKIVVSPP
jgi:imidazolonepropionase-like amidohydrolase